MSASKQQGVLTRFKVGGREGEAKQAGRMCPFLPPSPASPVPNPSPGSRATAAD